jgi:RHS repeat-associated protein
MRCWGLISWRRFRWRRSKFTGKQRDQGQGLDFFNAGYLYSAIGPFVSPDTLSAAADPYEPQTWNGYAYVNNNPLRDLDPDGMQNYSSGQGACDPGSGSSGSSTSGSGSGVSVGFGFSFGAAFRPLGPITPSYQLGASQGFMFQASTVDQMLASLPLLSQRSADIIAAFTDTFSLGATQKLANDFYNRKGDFYLTASMAAMGASFLTAEGEFNAVRAGVYVLRDAEGVRMRSGGTGNLALIRLQHDRDLVLGNFVFEVVHRTDSYAERRGLDQLLHDAPGGAATAQQDSTN